MSRKRPREENGANGRKKSPTKMARKSMPRKGAKSKSDIDDRTLDPVSRDKWDIEVSRWQGKANIQPTFYNYGYNIRVIYKKHIFQYYYFHV